MKPPTAAQQDRVEKLRSQYAVAQAAADSIRAKLNRLEATIAGEPERVNGLDMIWSAAPPMARTRSSKQRCRVAWLRVPAAARPRVLEVLAALESWSKCDEWRKDDGQFIPALHRFISERKWEDLPAKTVVDPSARYRSAKLPDLPPVAPEHVATPEFIREMCASLANSLK